MNPMQAQANRFEKKGIRTVAIVDLQWGDTGKGKFVDLYAEWADIIARGTGGANAGHTIKVGDQTSVLHLVPAGILWDKQGKKNIIGRGVAVDPRTLSHEIAELLSSGNTVNGLRISKDARLVLPIDIALDRLKDAGAGSGKVGTTGRGIEPTYASRVSRIGLTVNDLLNKDVFAKKLKANCEARRDVFKKYRDEDIKTVVRSEAMENGAFEAGGEKIFDPDAIVERYLHHAKRFREMVSDTDLLLQNDIGKKRVLLEGAQGVLLSVEYGAHPYVTSSDCSLVGLTQGVGLRTEHVDYSIGIVKAPYMTRVGNGPFPTELGGSKSDSWCNRGEGSKSRERNEYPKASINSPDPFEQGVAIRQLGDEYGATTGRPRRTGWLDLPLLRYASQYGGVRNSAPHIATLALTKLDVLDSCESIKVCLRYKYEGDDYRVGDKLLTRGEFLDVAIMDSYVLERCIPIYIDFPGWRCSLSNITSEKELPKEVQELIHAIEYHCKVKVDMLSVGPKRGETLFL